MNNGTYTATPDLAKAAGILETMLEQDKFFPAFEWNDRDELDQDSYLVWDMESDCFRGPWPMVGRVNRMLNHTSDKEKIHRWTSKL